MKIIQAIINFFKNFFYNRKLKKLTQKLQKGAQEKNQDRKKLQFLIALRVKRYLKKSPHNKSEYIPPSFEERKRIAAILQKDFKDQLGPLNVTINHEFKLV
jgi:hypothetical protein